MAHLFVIATAATGGAAYLTTTHAHYITRYPVFMLCDAK